MEIAEKCVEDFPLEQLPAKLSEKAMKDYVVVCKATQGDERAYRGQHLCGGHGGAQNCN